MSTSKLMLYPITSLEKIKTYTSWKQYLSCKVNLLLPELIKCNDEYHYTIKSECDMRKTDNERRHESVRNTTPIVFNPPSKIDIDSFINSLSHHNIHKSLKIIFRKYYFEYENVLPIFPEVILPIIFPYLFLPEIESKKKPEFLFQENSNNFTKPKVKDFLSDERKKGFKCCYILNRDDEMQINLQHVNIQ